jgi:probable phosphoglycerate mutase
LTTLLLIRHAVYEAVGHFVAGRQSGYHLGEEGRKQVAALCDRLTTWPIRHVYASPLERTQETARPLAERLGVEVVTAEELIELDFGDWTGKRFDQLEYDPLWRRYNAYRSGIRLPNGESMLEVQARVVGFIQRLRDAHPDETIALVSHGDVIRAALLYYMGVPLDLFARIEVHPAGVNVLHLFDDGAQVASLNAFAEGLP